MFSCLDLIDFLGIIKKAIVYEDIKAIKPILTYETKELKLS